MKYFLSVLLFIQLAYAHDHSHHQHEDLASTGEISESSLYILKEKWTTQKGEKFQLKDVSGKPALLFMAYTKCKTACPLLVQDVKKILKKLPEDKNDLKVIMFSFDSEKETADSLDKFFKERKLSKNWTLLTGDERAVNTIAAVLGVRFKKLPDGEYVHSNSIYFMDKSGKIQGTQEGLNKVDPKFIKILQEHL